VLSLVGVDGRVGGVIVLSGIGVGERRVGLLSIMSRSGFVSEVVGIVLDVIALVLSP
jgi:hypothetical protein